MVAFYLLVSVMPFIRHPLWSELIGDVTLVKYVGMICLGYALLRMAAIGSRPHFFATWQSRWFIIFAALGMASFLALGIPQPFEVSPFMSLASFLLFFFVTLVVVDSTLHLRLTLLVAVGSVAYASLHVLREWQKYGGMSFGFRPGWVSGDPNYFSVSALLCLPVAFYLLGTRQARWERSFCIASLVVMLVALTLAASRGALLGIVAGSLLMVWRSPRRLRSLLLVGSVLLPLMLLTPASPLDRLLHPTHSDQESSDIRTILWDAGLNMISEHPLRGIGAGNFKHLVKRFTTEDIEFIAHNTYVELGAELGLPGLLLFLAVLFATFRTLRQVQRDPSSSLLVRQASLGLEAGLLTTAVALFFVSAYYQKLLWLFIFLSMCLPSLREQSSDAGAGLPAPERSTSLDVS